MRCRFDFANTGRGTLEIEEVVESCGCATVGDWPATLAPGGRGQIPLEFDTVGYDEAIDKSVVVLSNDPASPIVVLQLEGEVWSPLEIKPDYLVFNVVAGDPLPPARLVRIVNRLADPIALETPSTTEPAFAAEIRPLRAGREYEMSVRLAATPPVGTKRAQIAVKTSAAEAASFTVTAVAVVQPPMIVAPPEIRLPALPIATNSTLRLLVRGQGALPLREVTPRVELAGVRCQVQELRPGRLFEVLLSLPAGFDLPPDRPAKLNIRTGNASTPHLEVPILRAQAPQP